MNISFTGSLGTSIAYECRIIADLNQKWKCNLQGADFSAYCYTKTKQFFEKAPQNPGVYLSYT